MKIKLISLDKCEGHASIVFSKGKVKPGYDLNIKIKWSGEDESEEGEATGFMECEEVFKLNNNSLLILTREMTMNGLLELIRKINYIKAAKIV